MTNSNVIPLDNRPAAKKEIEDIQRNVKARKVEENEKYGPGDGGGDDVSSGFVRDCLRMNELGDGLLFRELHRGKFVFNKTMDSCKNAIIDLKTGGARDGLPGDFLQKHAAAQWRGPDEPCEEWERFLAQVLEEDHLPPEDGRPMCAFMQRLLGHAIVGEAAEHIFAVFEGIGRNGKGTIQRIMIHVLGNLAGPVRSEMLLDQSRNMSSAGPTPDIMALRGLRVAFAYETDEGCRVSAARVKWMTGGDELTGRNPHDKYEVSWTPTHSLFLMTNHKPNAPAEDFAFWQRMHLVPFILSFVKRYPQRDYERQADPDLESRLIKEASGILAWLVRGCLQWQQTGLRPPPKVLEANEQYQYVFSFFMFLRSYGPKKIKKN